MTADLDFAQFFRVSPNAYLVLDRSLVIVDANPAYLAATQRRREDLIGRPLFEAFPGDPQVDQVALVQNSLRSVLSSGEPHHIPLVRYAIAVERDGQPVSEDRFWSTTHTPLRDAEGQVRYILQHTVDVTELQRLRRAARDVEQLHEGLLASGVLARAEALQRANQALVAQQRWLTQLLEHAPGAVAVFRGPEHVVEMCNQAYLQLVGHRQIVGRTVREAFPEITGQGYFELLDGVYRSGEPFVGRGMPVQMQREPDGPLEERYVDFLLQPVFDSDGGVSGIFCQAHDITEQRRAQQEMNHYRAQLEALLRERTAALERSKAEHAQTQAQLQHVQKLEAIGRLTGGVAHDFNNVLQVLSNSLQLLQRMTLSIPQAQRWIGIASNAVANGSKLTAQLLAFARRQPLEPRTINVGRLVRGMDDLLRRTLGDGIEIETIIAGGLWNTFADPNQLENVLLNLAINARDAMGDEGRITIETSNAMLDEHYAATHSEVKPGQYVMLGVSDTGCGMAPEVVERAFEPFFSTKPEGRGTGLGLSMVYGFVKQSGGHVKIYSEVGVGTTVKIYLPRVAQPEEDVGDVMLAGPVAGGDETILVVEDDPQVLATTVAMLTELGYRVLKAQEATSALAIVQSGIPIDLLFTDVVMPGPMRSPELARQAQALLPDLQVLFTSGYTENAIVHGGRLDPGVHLISKPYRREDLARRIRQLLQSSRARRIERIAEAQLAPSGLRVLFVEDDAELRLMGEELLLTLGYQVTAVPSGEEALHTLAASPFDVMLADVALPGISGVRLARQAREQSPKLPVVLASGYGRTALPDADDMLDNMILLPKPYTLEGLERAIRTALAGRVETT